MSRNQFHIFDEISSDESDDEILNNNNINYNNVNVNNIKNNIINNKNDKKNVNKDNTYNENKINKDKKNSKDSKDNNDNKNKIDNKDNNDNKDNKDNNDNKDNKDNKDNNDNKEYEIKNEDNENKVKQENEDNTENNQGINNKTDYLDYYNLIDKNKLKTNEPDNNLFFNNYNFLVKNTKNICKNVELGNDYENKKKILCYNILNKGSCSYGNKCLYAHSLEEQKINNKIKIIYDLIKKNTSLENINLVKERHLYNGFIHLTKLCPMCIKGNCPGGYNCKYGAFSKKFQICKNDLLLGICNNENCKLIHLTSRGLTPYIKSKKEYSLKKNNNENIKNILKNNEFQNISFLNNNLLNKNIIEKIYKINNNDYNSDSNTSSCSDSEDNIKYYLSNDSDEEKDSDLDSLEESIFIE